MDEFTAVRSSKYAGGLVLTGSLDNCIMSKPVPPGNFTKITLNEFCET